MTSNPHNRHESLWFNWSSNHKQSIRFFTHWPAHLAFIAFWSAGPRVWPGRLPQKHKQIITTSHGTRDTRLLCIYSARNYSEVRTFGPVPHKQPPSRRFRTLPEIGLSRLTVVYRFSSLISNPSLVGDWMPAPRAHPVSPLRTLNYLLVVTIFRKAPSPRRARSTGPDVRRTAHRSRTRARTHTCPRAREFSYLHSGGRWWETQEQRRTIEEVKRKGVIADCNPWRRIRGT